METPLDKRRQNHDNLKVVLKLLNDNKEREKLGSYCLSAGNIIL